MAARTGTILHMIQALGVRQYDLPHVRLPNPCSRHGIRLVAVRLEQNTEIERQRLDYARELPVPRLRPTSLPRYGRRGGLPGRRNAYRLR